MKNKLQLNRENILILAALVIYALATSFNLTIFPLYFFCDEAIHGVEADSILRTYRDHSGGFLPLYPISMGQYQWSLSIYAQIPFIWLFGLNEWAVRFRNVFFSVFAIFALIRLFESWGINKNRFLIPIFFLVSPIWFLHMRTGFEAPIAAFCLIACLFFYSKTIESAKTLDFSCAALFLALTFYAYQPARAWAILSAVFILVINFRFHLKHLAKTFIASVLFIMLLIPAIIFSMLNTEASFARLNAVGLAEFLRLPIPEQLNIGFTNYSSAFDPRFWFTWASTYNDAAQLRHVIPELSLIPIFLLPFSLIGLICLLYQAKNNLSIRAFIVTWLICPIASSPFGFNNLRIYWVGIGYIIMSAYGLLFVLSKLSQRRDFLRHAVTALTIFLCLYSAWFLHYVTQKAGSKYSDYGFGGLQSGQHEVFEEIKRSFSKNPERRIYLGHDAFNGTETLISFYLPENEQKLVEIIEASKICESKNFTLNETGLFIFRSETLKDVIDSGCPITVEKEKTIFTPTSERLFEIVSLKARPEFTTWVMEKDKARHIPLKNDVLYRGKKIQLEHSRLDIGSIEDLFDENPLTLIRSEQLNPLLLKIDNFNAEISSVEAMFSHVINAKLEVFCWNTIGKREQSNLVGDLLGTDSASLNGQKSLWLAVQVASKRCDSLELKFYSDNQNPVDNVHVHELKIN